MPPPVRWQQNTITGIGSQVPDKEPIEALAAEWYPATVLDTERAPQPVGVLIRERRKVLRIGQAELARVAGMSREWVKAVESGLIEKPDRDAIGRMAGLLEIPASALLRAAGYDVPAAPRLDNIEFINPDDYTPEQAALIARVLDGVATVFRAKARGET